MLEVEIPKITFLCCFSTIARKFEMYSVSGTSGGRVSFHPEAAMIGQVNFGNPFGKDNVSGCCCHRAGLSRMSWSYHSGKHVNVAEQPVWQ